jgi:hypothetical protein
MGVSEKSYMMRTVASRGSLVQQLLQVLLFCSHVALLLQQVAAQGSWKVIVENAGIASMHTAITHYNTAVLLDRTDIGPSQLPLPNGVCRNDANDESSKHDCTAHSALLDLATNTISSIWISLKTKMFKLLVALSLLVAIQGQLGGFINRLDLVDSEITQPMIKMAIQKLSATENVQVSLVKVVDVATQIVNGINYRINFIGRSLSTNTFVTCATQIYQPFNGPESVTSVKCA